MCLHSLAYPLIPHHPSPSSTGLLPGWAPTHPLCVQTWHMTSSGIIGPASNATHTSIVRLCSLKIFLFPSVGTVPGQAQRQMRCRCVGERERLCLVSQRVQRGSCPNCVRAKAYVVCDSPALYCGSFFSSTFVSLDYATFEADYAHAQALNSNYLSAWRWSKANDFSHWTTWLLAACVQITSETTSERN